MLCEYFTKELKMEYLIFERYIPFSFEKAMHLNLQVFGIPLDALPPSK